ncbi:uncharacterized protein BDW43DRAFT_260384 [Aspergillus alliaceus]|uniref:uncharacterized protein n=1 Tax=Petromyces alliaceus TaxID=209559 RepID=UPI0012A4EB61|nr:uncharacterized protein BDW43DRAFT_260384 [Aspergillus alliaceus]KAB8238970.1 hypothetical protein BDW43DRAFT_260384 [Aspergillus alliaceus]
MMPPRRLRGDTGPILRSVLQLRRAKMERRRIQRAKKHKYIPRASDREPSIPTGRTSPKFLRNNRTPSGSDSIHTSPRESSMLINTLSQSHVVICPNF